MTIILENSKINSGSCSRHCMLQSNMYTFVTDHISEQTSHTRVLPPATHCSAESTETVPIKCAAQGHNISIKPMIEQEVVVLAAVIVVVEVVHKTI